MGLLFSTQNLASGVEGFGIADGTVTCRKSSIAMIAEAVDLFRKGLFRVDCPGREDPPKRLTMRLFARVSHSCMLADISRALVLDTKSESNKR